MLESLQATPEHLRVIANFQMQMAMETEKLKLDRETLENGISAVLADPKLGMYWVIEEDGTPIGCTSVTPEWSDWRNKTWWWIQSVFIADGHRGRGVFRAMFEKLQEVANAREDIAGLRLYVDKTNANAQRVYEACGMRDEHYSMYELESRV